MNKRLILIVPLLIASIFFVSPVLPRAHAATGLVCVAFPSTTTTCPTSSPSIGPLASGSSFTIGVFIQGSDAMGGFDIYIHSDNSVLNPTAAALGTLIAGPSLTSICINGSASTGSCTVGTANGLGTVEVTTIEGSGNNECAGLSPCSGLAFTVTYQVVGAAASSQLTWPTATGCSASSVSSPPNVCVEVADNIGNILSESIQTPSATVTQSVASLVSVVTDASGAIYSSTFSGTTWSAWQSIPGKTLFPPAICSSGAGKAELVVVGTDGQLEHKSFAGGTWAALWDSAGGSLAGQPSCAFLNGILYVVARAPDTPNSLYANSRTGTGTWTGWIYLAGASHNTPTLVASSGLSRLDLVVRGDDNRIYHKSFASGAWAATWDTPAGGTLASPAAASDGTLLYVVVQGQDNGVWYNTLTLSSNTWGTWTYLNSGTTSAPAVAIDSGGVVHIVVRGQNNGIYHDTKPTTGPPGTSWTSSSGGLASDSPAANALGTNLVILVRGSDNGLYFNTLTGAAFGTWASANGASPNAPVVANL